MVGLLGVDVIEGVEFDEDAERLVRTCGRSSGSATGVEYGRGHAPGMTGRRRRRAMGLGTFRALLEGEAPRVRCRVHGLVAVHRPTARAAARLRAYEILEPTATRITNVVDGGGPRGHVGQHWQAASDNEWKGRRGGDLRRDSGLTRQTWRPGRMLGDVLGHDCVLVSNRCRPRRSRHPGKVRAVADGSGRRPTTGRRAIPRSRSRRRRARSRAHRGRRCRASG